MAEGRKKTLPQPLPIEAIEEILSRVRARSLLRFRSISKSWFALIRDPYFVMKNLRNSNRNNTRSIAVYDRQRSRKKFTSHFGASLECCETYDLPPVSHNELGFGNPMFYHVMGNCNGIIFIRYRCLVLGDNTFLWNPVTRQVKALPESSVSTDVFPWAHDFFGFDETANDYKMLRIHLSAPPGVARRAEVYTLRADCWRRSRVPQELHGASISRKVNIYANGCVLFVVNYDDPINCKIVLFDLKNEEFRLIDFPIHHVDYQITKWNDDSCVAYVEISSGCEMEMWVMERFWEAGSCWVKYLSISSLIPTPIRATCISFLGFLCAGEILIRNYLKGRFEIYSIDTHQSIVHTAPDVLSSFSKLVEVLPCYKESLVSLSSDDYT